MKSTLFYFILLHRFFPESDISTLSRLQRYKIKINDDGLARLKADFALKYFVETFCLF